MILTGKSKEDFEKWIPKSKMGDGYSSHIFINGMYLIFELMPETLQYAIIQEWFDSVGIYIETDFGKLDWGFTVRFNFKTIESLCNFETRNEALKAAITNANEIYNEKII